MDTNSIIESIKGINDLGNFMSDKLVDYMRSVDNTTYSVFFSKYGKTEMPNMVKTYSSDISFLSKIYISRVISKTTDFQVNNMVVSETKIEADLKAWFLCRHQSVGEVLALEKLKAVLPDIFENPQQYTKSLTDTLVSSSFINGMAVYCDIDPAHQQPLRLLWLLMKKLDGSSFQKIMDAWNKTPYSSVIGNFASFKWLDCVEANLTIGTKIFGAFLDDIKNACNKETETNREEKSDLVGQSVMGEPIIKRYTLVTYTKGVEVEKWIRNTSGYLSSGNANFTQRTVETGGGSGCVLRSTKVLVCNNEYIDIEDLRTGDNVTSEKLMPSAFSGEIVYNDHVKNLYSINDDKPFMSLDHMILTTNGYKCIEPETALKINRDISVSMLKVNDVVIKYYLDENNNIKKKYEKVKKINIVNNDLPCVDIHISNGYKSYITESGYVCFANYPEITSKSITDSLAASKNHYANRDFRRAFARNKKELKEAFGETGVNYIERLMENTQSETGNISLVSQKSPDHLLRSLDLVDMEVHTDENVNPGFSRLHIVRNHLFFDDNMENFTKLSVKDGNYYWKRMLDNGKMESGMLRMYGNGFYGEGIVNSNGNNMNFYVANVNTYDIKLTPVDNTKEVIDCGTYEMGYKKIDGVFVAVGDWKMSYKNVKDEKVITTAASTDPAYSNISYYIDKFHNLCCLAQFSGLSLLQFDALRLSGMQKSELAFDTTFSSIYGTAYKENGKDDNDITIGRITGTLESGAVNKILKMSDKIADMQMLSDYNTDAYELTIQEIDNINGLMNMSVLDLYNLPQPENMSDVHSECFDKLIKMSAHAAYHSGDEVSKYIGIAKPTVDDNVGDLTHAQAKIAEDNKDFFIDGLAMAYLSYSYSKSSDTRLSNYITAIPNYEYKIKYYMQGNDEGCMSRTSGYQTATNDLYKLIYASNVPGLSDYISDQNNSDWAKQLYEYCHTPYILNGLILTNLVEPNNTRINHLCTMLDALDTSGRISIGDNKFYSYGVALRKDVTDLTFKYAFKNFKIPNKNDKEGKKVIITMLTEFLKNYFNNLENHYFTNWTQEMYKEAQKDLEEAAKDAGYDSVQNYINNIADIASSVTEALLNMTNPDMPSRIVTFFENHPKVSKSFCMAFYSIGIMAVILGFKQWSELTPLEKTELIGDTVGIGITALNDISAWRSCSVFKQAFGDLQGADSAITAACTESDFTKAFAGSENIETALSKLGVEMGTVTTEESNIMASASKWMSVCRITSTAAKVASVFMMAAALGFQIYETIKDFENGQPVPIEVADIIQDVSCGVCFLAEAGSGILGLCGIEVCSGIPVVGVIFAVVGIITAIVMLFFPHKQPLSPIETFIKDKCVPFVKNAQDPPSKWVEKQKKQEAYLEKTNSAWDAIYIY